MKTALFLLTLSTLTYGAATDLQQDVAPKAANRAFCNVNLMGGFNVTGGRCHFFDEVMTGIVSLEPLTIRCSRVTVTCNRGGQPVEVSMEKPDESETN